MMTDLDYARAQIMTLIAVNNVALPITDDAGQKNVVIALAEEKLTDLTQRLNKVIAVVGANGAGKTQLIKPLAFLGWFVNSSFLGQESEQEIPYRPHALHADDPTEFTLHFVLQGEEYRYQLVLQRLRVVSEILSVKTSSQFSYLFKREKSEQGFTFKEKGFPFPTKLAQGLRDNASLLAAAYAYDIAEAKSFIDFCLSNRKAQKIWAKYGFELSA